MATPLGRLHSILPANRRHCNPPRNQGRSVFQAGMLVGVAVALPPPRNAGNSGVAVQLPPQHDGKLIGPGPRIGSGRCPSAGGGKLRGRRPNRPPDTTAFFPPLLSESPRTWRPTADPRLSVPARSTTPTSPVWNHTAAAYPLNSRMGAARPPRRDQCIQAPPRRKGRTESVAVGGDRWCNIKRCPCRCPIWCRQVRRVASQSGIALHSNANKKGRRPALNHRPQGFGPARLADATNSHDSPCPVYLRSSSGVQRSASVSLGLMASGLSASTRPSPKSVLILPVCRARPAPQCVQCGEFVIAGVGDQ